MSDTVQNLGEVARSLRARLIPGSREVGDLRRNAALYLAQRAGTLASSFGKGLVPDVDESRLGELAYLAAIGYLLGSNLIVSPPTGALLKASERVARRSAHTAERTGFADEPICAAGLLLLGRAINDINLTQILEKELVSADSPDPTLRLLLALIVSGSPVGAPMPAPTDPRSLAAALLARLIDENVQRRLFPSSPGDLEARLTAELLGQSVETREDFGALLVLVALEAVVAIPDPAAPVADGPCDVGIIIALREEFRVFFEMIRTPRTSVEADGRTYYVFEVPSIRHGRAYRCVAIFVGDMGPTRTGVIAEKMLGAWRPSTVVMLGIAGGIHKDIHLGDVVIATQVNNYLEGAKAVDRAVSAPFERSSDSFQATAQLADRVRNFEFSHAAAYATWQQRTQTRAAALPPKALELVREGLLRHNAETREGHIASGPVVVGSTTFASWIKEADRSCLAVEMEAAGMMIAAHLDPGKVNTLVLRGISDFADERKSLLDQIGGGALRTLAMRNAVSFFWALLESGLLTSTATS
jgi:nucleoside phosphorylase